MKKNTIGARDRIDKKGTLKTAIEPIEKYFM